MPKPTIHVYLCSFSKIRVDLIASGYDWACPKCEQWRKVTHIPQDGKVYCPKCKTIYKTNLAEHAYP